ncbi:MAG: DUF3426 domain-containing protein [Pedobacter sp.]|nr:DUF3426 domain-containing protein [Pedobacter sp.]
MTDTKQTKCPHCGSTFRISDAQLAAKGGSVRCGSCLQVFRADQHLVGAGAPPAVAKPAAPAAAKTKKKGAGNDEDWALALIGEKGGKPAGGAAPAENWEIPGVASESGSDDFGFSDDDISAFMVADQKAAPPPSNQGKSLRFDDELSDFLDDAGDGLQQPAPSETSHVLSESADESWAKSILSELEHEEKKQDSHKYGMEILDGKSKAPPKNPKMAAALGMGSRIAEEPVSRKAASKAAPAPAPVAKAPADDFLGDDADVLSFLDNDDLSSNSPAPLAPNPFSLDRPLAHVDAPVVLKPRREPINWGHLLSWTFLCLVAIAMFAAQYIYFNFEHLAVKPATRPWFEQACAEFGCRLPDIPDPSKLRVEELVVRKHPTEENALVVDAIVKNNARFPQPMPALLLRFTNNGNEVVASRLLKPMEYLRGEARLLRRMPPDTPIRISLDIVDPGTTAVNYSLDPIL